MSTSGPTQRSLLEVLRRRTPEAPRYELHEEIGKGGMGAVYEAFEPDLRRTLAIKMIRTRGPGTGADPSMLHRFLLEAQVMAQLNHPGVVPVHDIGLDEQGRVFFTMPLIRGRTLARVFEELRSGEGGWTRARVLELLLRACETTAYAHSQGVIHRDLKPANMMIGEFGEVYVLDWGLARPNGETTSGLAPLPGRATISTERDGLDPSSSLLTQAGMIVGTPAYMSPEQAAGRELDARSDVYSMGAVLYELISGAPPYTRPGARTPPLEVIRGILAGPPRPLGPIAPDASPELIAICEKAMARDPAERFPDMRETADELRAFLEGRVVRAYRTGVWIELRKWIGRNRRYAFALAGAMLAMVAGATATALVQRAGKLRVLEEQRRVLRLSDVKLAGDLVAEDLALWPPDPERSRPLSRWLGRADDVTSRIDEHRSYARELAARASGSPEDAWQLAVLEQLIGHLEELPALRRSIEERSHFAADVEARTVAGEPARARWSAAISAIASDPRYGGLALRPQLGLLPLERDPHSGLWEFSHVQSGAEPVRDPATGRWRIVPETGIVLVLLPQGTTTLGSKPLRLSGKVPATWDEMYELARESEDHGAPFHDPGRDKDEMFLESVELDAFFVSKYELTQAQYARVLGRNPSQHSAEPDGGPTHPVEALAWSDAREFCRRTMLQLPTEAQWEHACRGGTATPFSCGEEIESLLGFANVADESWLRASQGSRSRFSPRFDDGWVYHAPVGTLRANPFGLHDVHGNVWEWCAEGFSATGTPRPGDGSRGVDAAATKEGVIRGGSFFSAARDCRAANRFNQNISNSDGDMGLRLVRSIDS